MGWLDFAYDVPFVGDALGAVTGKSRTMSEQQMMASYDYSKQSELMDKQHELQKDFADYQNDLQRSTWMEQFSTQNQYNDPAKAAQRYLNAGITPSAAFGGSTVGQSTAAVQASPVSGGSLPNATPMRSIADYMNAGNMQFATVAQALASLATAFKGTTEGVKAAKNLNQEYQSLVKNNKLKDIEIQIADTWGLKQAEANYNKTQKEITSLLRQADLLFEQAENAKLDGMIKIEQRSNMIADRLLTLAKTEAQKTTNQSLAEFIRSEIQANFARAYNDYKQGDTQSSIKAMNDYTLQVWNDPNVRKAKVSEIVNNANAIRARKLLDEEKTKQLEQAIIELKNSNEYWDFSYWFQKAMQLVDTAGKFVHNLK